MIVKLKACLYPLPTRQKQSSKNGTLAIADFRLKPPVSLRTGTYTVRLCSAAPVHPVNDDTVIPRKKHGNNFQAEAEAAEICESKPVQLRC